jgi:predicted DNA-binding transcriptional regulator YafY
MVGMMSMAPGAAAAPRATTPSAEPLPDRPDWVEGSFRFDSYDAAARELVTLGPEVEVLLPVEVRETMAAVGRGITRLHQPTTPMAQKTDAGPG